MNIHSCQPGASRRSRATSRPPRAPRQARRHPARRHRHLRGPRLLQRPGRRRRPRRRRRRRHGLPLLPRQGRPARLDLRAHDEGGHRRGRESVEAPRRSRSTGCARSPGCTSTASDATATSPSSFQVELRQSTKFMERFSATHAPRIPRHHPGRRSPRAGARGLPQRAEPDAGGEAVLRRARRDGDQLDPEPRGSTRWSTRPTRSSICSSAASRRTRSGRDGAPATCRRPIGGTVNEHPFRGGARRRHDGRADRGAPRQRRRPGPAPRRHADAARDGLERAQRLKPDPFFTPSHGAARDAPAASTTTCRARRLPTGSSKRSSSGSTSSSALLARVDAHAPRRRRSSARTRRASRSRRSPRAAPDAFRGALARHALLQPAALPAPARADPDAPTPTRDRSRPSRRFAGSTASARASSSRRTRPTSSPTASASSASIAALARAGRAAAARSKRSTRSPARRSAGRRARRSGRWTSPGIDVLAHVARNLAERLAVARAIAPTVHAAAARRPRWSRRGWSARRPARASTRRTGRRDPDARSGDDGLPRRSSRRGLPSLDAARSDRDARRTHPRCSSRRSDKVGDVPARNARPHAALRRAGRAGDRLTRIDDVDRAMRWGFGWELGPFEMLGRHRRRTRRRCDVRRPICPALVDRSAVDAVRSVLTASRRRSAFAPSVPPGGPAVELLRAVARQRRRRASGTPGQPRRSRRRRARGRVPLEDERHRRRHDPDAAGRRHARPSANFRALVVGNEAANFSAGANLMLLLLEAQEGNWDEVDLMVRAFQGATMALKYADVPVVVAPAGLTLGGGCEICAARRPRAGRRRNLHGPRRSRRRADPRRRRHERDARARDGGLRRPARIRCRTCSACSRRSASARSRRARRRAAASATCATSTRLTMNRDRLIADAKARGAGARGRVRAGRSRGRRSGSAAKACWRR